VRVLFVAPYPPERDGIGTYSQMICGELARQGHTVGVLTARPSPDAPSEVLGSLPGPLERGDQALAAVSRFGPDVIHVQFAFAAYGTRIPSLLRTVDRLRRAGSAPVVMTLHEVTRDVESLRAAGRALYRLAARRADQVVVHTETAVAAYQALGAGLPPVVVIAHPRTELPRAEVTPAQLRARYGLGDDRVVLSFGFIDVDKGISDLIEAAGLLHAAGELGTATVVVAGAVRRRFGPLRVFEARDRRYLRSLRHSAVRLGLGDRVRFVGFVPAAEIRAWFDLATVAVLPYRRIEQSGVGSLASAAGTPMLTSNVGELAKLSTFTPFPPADPRALAHELRRCLVNDGTASTLHSPGGDVAEIVTETAGLYERLCGRRPVGAPAA
jgi:glycosyltransferase involved in cell wall biosynthesis